MNVTIFLLLFTFVGWTCSASVSSKQNKRGIYADGSFYGTHGILFNDPINAHNLPPYKPQKTLVASSAILPSFDVHFHRVQPQFPSYGFGDFSSFLPTQESVYQSHLPSFTPSFTSFDVGYNYPVPFGPKFEEEPIPSAFNLLISPAMRQLPLPDPKLAPGYRPPPRRIINEVNQNLFYQYPGYIHDSGLMVRLPIAMTRPTRVVVPQHGVIAFGSGALGYSTLPGGKIALGSGSVGLSNVAVARAGIQQRKVINPTVQSEQDFSFPSAFSLKRRADINLDESSSSNSLTVFPTTEEQRGKVLV